MHAAYINSIGKFLPGSPIGNDEMEDYLGRIDDRPSKVKNRILKSNGIQQRYYALDRQQNGTYSNGQMAAAAVRDALSQVDIEPAAIDLLAAGTTWADVLVPGFASMVHGELSELSPLETISSQGVCCAGISALKYAASQVELGRKQNAIAVAAEMPSRLFKHTRFEAEDAIKAGKPLPFDTEFLRWMLSDGAGALLVRDRPNERGISLKVEWIELISHANAYPVCMSAGVADTTQQKTWMQYASYLDAAKDGALNLRQNIRLLDDVMKLGVAGWLRLSELGRVKPSEIDWLLCHYSSHFFRGQIVDLLDKAGCMIPEYKWFTNLYTRGNTGCASIYLMLEELFNSDKLQDGQKIFCFIPESGRFTTAYMMLTVVDSARRTLRDRGNNYRIDRPQSIELPVAIPSTADPELPSAYLMRQLALVWLEFERDIRSVSIVRKLHRGEFTLNDYKALLRNLRPQVVEGARMFIIEGLGNKLAGQWAAQLQQTLGLQAEQVSFLAYHSANDEHHIGKLTEIFNAEWMTEEIAHRIVKTARVTARLYLLQLEEVRAAN